MASVLYQSIEMLSRDKGIDPAVVVGAVEDAIALATRKYYKTQETMRAEMDKETGEIRAYVYKTVVETPEEVEDEMNQISLEQRRELAPEVEVGGELRFYKDTTPLAASQRRWRSRLSSRRCARLSAIRCSTSTTTARARC